MRNADLGALLISSRDNLIGFRQRAAERLLRIDALRTRSDGSHEHGVMLVDVPWTHSHDVGLQLGEHRVVVSIAFVHLELLQLGSEALRIGICDRDDLHLGHQPPHRVDAMPIIAAPRVPNDRNAEFRFSG